MHTANNEYSFENKMPVFTPEVDIYEDGNTIVILANMPGVEQKNLDVSIENNMLSISGIQNSESRESAELLHKGYETGIFKRTFGISAEIDSASVSAKINNGVLKLTLPKAEKAKAKKITVEA